ncbi:MAG TPA: hypothetical protein VMJ10_15385 [Kofleriaceae bacterium]|nr:hypothetical protein [Kofleriaceae bacterium]
MTSRLVLVALFALAACKKSKPSDSNPSPSPSPSPSPTSSSTDHKPANGLSITDNLAPDFSGTYDQVLAQVRDYDHRTVIAFVRGCPTLTCDPGAWEIEQVAHVCPKASVATVAIEGEEVGKFHVDMKISGPADNESTVTVEHVSVELTRVEHDGVDGSVHVENSDARVTGSFHAAVCPRT